MKGVSPTGQQSIPQPAAMQVVGFPQEFLSQSNPQNALRS
jgi:hypothetical protein